MFLAVGAVSNRRSLVRSHQGTVRAVTLVCCLLPVTGCDRSTPAADDRDARGVPGSETTSGGNVQSGQSLVHFPTWDAPKDIAAPAGFEGELVIGADDCLYLRNGYGALVLGIWPSEFTWSLHPPGVRKPDGHVLRVGERVAASAATGSDELEFTQCTEAVSTVYLWPPERL